jgi:hypothetical protein
MLAAAQQQYGTATRSHLERGLVLPICQREITAAIAALGIFANDQRSNAPLPPVA